MAQMFSLRWSKPHCYRMVRQSDSKSAPLSKGHRPWQPPCTHMVQLLIWSRTFNIFKNLISRQNQPQEIFWSSTRMKFCKKGTTCSWKTRLLWSIKSLIQLIECSLSSTRMKFCKKGTTCSWKTRLLWSIRSLIQLIECSLSSTRMKFCKKGTTCSWKTRLLWSIKSLIQLIECSSSSTRMKFCKKGTTCSWKTRLLWSIKSLIQLLGCSLSSTRMKFCKKGTTCKLKRLLWSIKSLIQLWLSVNAVKLCKQLPLDNPQTCSMYKWKIIFYHMTSCLTV